MVAMARAIRGADPDVPVALSEPWAWHPHVSLADQGRPFTTLLGKPDPVAEPEQSERAVQQWKQLIPDGKLPQRATPARPS